jgi:hypothetical protein
MYLRVLWNFCTCDLALRNTQVKNCPAQRRKREQDTKSHDPLKRGSPAYSSDRSAASIPVNCLSILLWKQDLMMEEACSWNCKLLHVLFSVIKSWQPATSCSETRCNNSNMSLISHSLTRNTTTDQDWPGAAEAQPRPLNGYHEAPKGFGRPRHAAQRGSAISHTALSRFIRLTRVEQCYK